MKIKPILENIKCSAAAPTAKVLANEQYVYLIFFVEDSSVQDAENSPFNRVPIDQICSLRFNKYTKYQMGSSYDDVDLEPYSFQEIIDSEWIADLNHGDHSENFRHIIIPFQDDCFEVICKDFILMPNPCQTIREEVLRLAELV